MPTHPFATTTVRPRGISRTLASAGLALAALLGAGAVQAQPTGRLNDTGQTQCYNGSALVACTAANTGDGVGVAHPRQDGRFGRDRAGMTKVGGGAAGFDFTKICWNGDAEGSGTCTGTLVANTGASASGTPSTDWACTKDNHTNLIWSLQTVSTMTWTNAINTGGNPIAAHDGTRCGPSTGWRVPTRRELLSIVHRGASSPAIDGSYFPGTVNSWYWTNDEYVPSPAGAWNVDFSNGGTYAGNKANTDHVRLVRSGQ